MTDQVRKIPVDHRTVYLDVQVDRPSGCPAEGVVEAFDAGWNAHEVGLERETVRVFSAMGGKDAQAWALMGWESRALAAYVAVDGKIEEALGRG